MSRWMWDSPSPISTNVTLLTPRIKGQRLVFFTSPPNPQSLLHVILQLECPYARSAPLSMTFQSGFLFRAASSEPSGIAGTLLSIFLGSKQEVGKSPWDIVATSLEQEQSHVSLLLPMVCLIWCSLGRTASSLSKCFARKSESEIWMESVKGQILLNTYLWGKHYDNMWGFWDARGSLAPGLASLSRIPKRVLSTRYARDQSCRHRYGCRHE